MVHKSNSKSLLYTYYDFLLSNLPTTNFYFASVQIALYAEDKKTWRFENSPG